MTDEDDGGRVTGGFTVCLLRPADRLCKRCPKTPVPHSHNNYTISQRLSHSNSTDRQQKHSYIFLCEIRDINMSIKSAQCMCVSHKLSHF